MVRPMVECLHGLCFLSLTAATLFAAPEATKVRYVLGPTSATAVGQILDLSRPLSGGGQLHASIAKDKVVVKVGNTASPRLHVTLVRDQAAPVDAPRGGGLALLTSPGPAPAGWVKELATRLKMTKAQVQWQALVPKEIIRDPPPLKGRTLDELRPVLVRIEHDIRAKDWDKARAALSAVTGPLRPEVRVEVAHLWLRMNAQAKAMKVLGDMSKSPPVWQAVARLLQDPKVDVGDTLKTIGSKEKCDLTAGVDMLYRVGALKQAIVWAEAIAAAGCPAAVERLIGLLQDADRPDEAYRVAQEGRKRYPKHVGIMGGMASVLRTRGDMKPAVYLLEKIARLSNGEGLSLINLLATVVRSGDVRTHFKKEYETLLREKKDDHLARFLVGVIQHYDNDFAASNANLTPLLPVYGHADRLHVYLAMNDFNLGRRDDALARLDSRVKGADPDPDVFYCRAEILRDTDRQTARKDLEHYRNISGGKRFSNPEKDKRITTLIDLLNACLKDKRASCEGPWEHPRLRHEGKGRYWTLYAVIGFSLLMLGALAWRKRKPRR
jgi:tetratricopeptide (TPR) repeat protein